MSEDTDGAVEVVAVPMELQAVALREGVAANTQRALVESFAPHHAAITTALASARTVQDGADPLQRKLARECRLELRRVRCAVEDTRKAAKADALRYGKAVDGMANVLKFLCEPEEDRLDGIEKYEERQEAARVAALTEERAALLTAEGGNPALYALGVMDVDTWGALLGATRKQRLDKIEADRAAEAARISKEQADIAERERLRAEAEAARIEAERERKARAEAEAKAKAESDRIEAERQKERAEAAAKQRKADEAVSKARAEAEAARIREEQRLALERDKAEEERQRQRKAAAAPDAQKLLAFADLVCALEVPAVKSEEARKIADGATAMRDKLAAWIVKRVASL